MTVGSDRITVGRTPITRRMTPDDSEEDEAADSVSRSPLYRLPSTVYRLPA
jgi:hypothetical protein